MLECLGCTLETAHYVGWDAVVNWARHLGSDSKTFASLNPEYSSFGSRLKTNILLADIYDAIMYFAWMYACSHREKGTLNPLRPKRYPRPGIKDDDVHIGKDPIPIKDFDSWYYKTEVAYG